MLDRFRSVLDVGHIKILDDHYYVYVYVLDENDLLKFTKYSIC
jgi:hypothetical protein